MRKEVSKNRKQGRLLLCFGLFMMCCCSCSLMKQSDVHNRIDGRENRDMDQAGLKEGRTSYTEKRLSETKEKLTAYLEEKYKEKFFVTETGLKGVLEENDYIVAYSEAFPEEYFNAYQLEDGSMKDEYYGVFYRKETGAYIQEMIRGIVEDCFVSARMYGSYGAELTSDIPLEEGMSQIQEQGEKLNITGNIYIKDHGETEQELKSMEQDIKELLSAHGLDGVYGIYHITTEVNSNMTLKELSELRVNKENFDWNSAFVIK